jgi:medium-chain acyl-[acyl-carrier-protein] hydrolase
MEPLVADLAEAMWPLLDRPLMLLGHSMGALVAFELARALRRRHGPVPLGLFAAACAAPQLPRRTALHKLPSAELWAELRYFGGTPEQVLGSDELKALVEPALRADLEICETYRYVEEAPLDCPIVAFGGDDDHDVTLEELRAWKAQTTSSFRISTFAGGHFFIGREHPDMLEAIGQSV